jgi:CBS domain-containing protein
MDPITCILETKANKLYVATPDDTVVVAVEAMCVARIGARLIMDDSVLAGIFCEHDVMTRVVLTRRDPCVTMIGDVMTREVVCIEPDTSVREAMKLMTKRRVRHLPVADGSQIVGMVSIGDLVRWTAEESSHLIEQGQHQIGDLHDYVAGRYPG